MNTLQKYIRELNDFSQMDEENGIYNNYIPIDEAQDLLERFEAEMIKELDCEQLEQLKKEGILV